MLKKITAAAAACLLLLAAAPACAFASTEYYYQDSKAIDSYFDRTLLVTNPSHNCGRIYFANEGSYNVSVRVYAPDGSLIANRWIAPSGLPGKPLDFRVGAAGAYQLLIQNGGKENIAGTLTAKTFFSPDPGAPLHQRGGGPHDAPR